jgi:Host cell surface-exposed lipoprotein
VKKIYAVAPVPVAVVAIAACGTAKPIASHTTKPPAASASSVIDADGGTCARSALVNGYCPGDSPVTPPPPAPTTSPPPQYTVSEQQAMDAAESYLSEGTGFSYQGLINQLSSQYGNGFSVADATFAVNTLNPNWDQQATDAAHGYMTSEPGWSACGLMQQLDSPYGGYFTQAQAEYGVQSGSLGTC